MDDFVAKEAEFKEMFLEFLEAGVDSIALLVFHPDFMHSVFDPFDFPKEIEDSKVLFHDFWIQNGV
jgi:hypothetical protein